MKRRYILPGLLLIFAGLYFLVAALPGIMMPAGLFFIAIGAALLVSRLVTRKHYGLTIAGFILLWLGAGQLMLDVLHIGAQYGLVAVPLGIALAFFLTHIFEYRRLGNWPIIPALILLGFAVMFFLILTPDVNAIFKPYYGTVVPLLLIVLGICILVKGGKRSKSKKHAEPVMEAKFEPAEEDIPAPEHWAQPPVEPAAQAVEEEPATVIPAAEIPAQEPEHAQETPDAAETEAPAEVAAAEEEAAEPVPEEEEFEKKAE